MEIGEQVSNSTVETMFQLLGESDHTVMSMAVGCIFEAARRTGGGPQDIADALFTNLPTRAAWDAEWYPKLEVLIEDRCKVMLAEFGMVR